MEYVYVYKHPDHQYLYVGRTNNLKKRIYAHAYKKSDNIEREYVSLLLESTIYYYELENKAEAIMVETYLINEHKPYLNKSMNYKNKSNGIQMILPTPKIFGELPDVYSGVLVQIKNECTEIIQEISNAKKQQAMLKDELSRCELKNVQIQERIALYKPKSDNNQYQLYTLKEVQGIISQLTETDNVEFISRLYGIDGSMVRTTKIVKKMGDIKWYTGIDGGVMEEIPDGHWGIPFMFGLNQKYMANKDVSLMYENWVLENMISKEKVNAMYANKHRDGKIYGYVSV